MSSEPARMIVEFPALPLPSDANSKTSLYASKTVSYRVDSVLSQKAASNLRPHKFGLRLSDFRQCAR